MLERDRDVTSECLCAIDRSIRSMHQPPPRIHVYEGAPWLEEANKWYFLTQLVTAVIVTLERCLGGLFGFILGRYGRAIAITIDKHFKIV